MMLSVQFYYSFAWNFPVAMLGVTAIGRVHAPPIVQPAVVCQHASSRIVQD